MRRAFVLVIVAILLPAPAVAQGVGIEVAGGYNVVSYKRESQPDLLPVGFFASVALKPTGSFAIASELTAEFQTDTGASPRLKRKAFAFLDGPRYIQNLRTTPWGAAAFVEVLFGIAHDRDFLSDRAANHFVWQPGGGVDITLSDRLSVRFQGSARFESFDSVITTRFMSGVVVTGRRSAKESADRYARAVADAAKAKADADKAKADADQARADADKAKADADRAKPGTKEAEARIKEAEARRTAAEARSKEAEARRLQAEKRPKP